MDGNQVEIGLSSYSYRWAILQGDMDIKDFLNRACSLEVSRAQICENLDFLASNSDQRKSIKETFGSRLIIETGYRGHNPFELEKALIATWELGAKTMRLIPEGVEEKKIDLDAIKSDLASMIPLLERLDLQLCLENHFSIHPEKLSWLVEQLACSRISICFDCFNSFALNVCTFEALDALLPFITQIHIKDVSIERSGNGFHIKGCKLGNGILDITRLRDRLMCANKNVPWLIESWRDLDGDITHTITLEDLEIREGIKYLRRHVHE